MSLNRYVNSDAVESASDRCNCRNSCDSESARALKCILSLLDDLNNSDLRILADVIERLVCSRKR
ncbi:hypothetical protein ACRQU7_17545 [Caproiciproducens sp. R1]|uniref:hypothetical protein n=1 Tax=Caproiciproducens sp. R1 TaxID=3435000 RepID=UPI0040343354